MNHITSGFAMANFHDHYTKQDQAWIKAHIEEYFQGYQFTANYGQGGDMLTLEWKVSDKPNSDPLPPYIAALKK